MKTLMTFVLLFGSLSVEAQSIPKAVTPPSKPVLSETKKNAYLMAERKRLMAILDAYEPNVKVKTAAVEQNQAAVALMEGIDTTKWKMNWETLELEAVPPAVNPPNEEKKP